MSDYRIYFKPSVEKDLQELADSEVSIIMNRIEGLMVNPFPSRSIKLTGTKRTFRIRIRDYKVIYEVDKSEKRITVLYIRHRLDAYRSI